MGTQLTQLGMPSIADMSAEEYFTQGNTQNKSQTTQQSSMAADDGADDVESSECDLAEEEKTCLAQT